MPRTAWRKVTAEEIAEMKLYWMAGFGEHYIGTIFNRDRGVVRKIMREHGLPSIHIVRHQRAMEWLNEQRSKENRTN